MAEAMTIRRLFGDLRVRPKLMVLHNLFFLVLTAAAYFSLIPPYERQVPDARERELRIIAQIFQLALPLTAVEGLEEYQYREGSAAEIAMPGTVERWLAEHPGSVWRDSASSRYLFAQDPKGSGQYRRLTIPEFIYGDSVRRAQITLFLILGALYLLAVLILELLIMPLYVYKPIQRMLDADEATQRGDREREMIPETVILGDEIGQIMRSRNATVAQLRGREDDLRHKNEMLEMQDRLASLGLMSASVAHEMNTPLAVLHGSIEKLLETAPQDSPAHSRLARMKRVTERLRRISESLLDFAKARREKMERLQLATLIDEAWGLVAIDEKANDIEFHNLVSDEAALTGNADRLLQVFVNLLRNALNATSESSGRIEVKSEQVRVAGESWISVRVEDNGTGIAPEVLPDIFDAFVTTRLDSKGTGLGLTVAEGIISQHGGTIHASNRQEGGACLEVRLPVEGPNRG
jgi:signal transduction histidine kinase